MLETLKEILIKATGNKNIEISLETNLKNDLGLTSFDLAQLACDVEDEFDIEIPDREIKNIKTVGDVINFINKTKN